MLSEGYSVNYYYNSGEKNTGSLSLSLFLSPGSFEYAISTDQFKTIIELCHVQLNESYKSAEDLKSKMQFLIQNYLLDQKKFEKVNVALLNTDFAMIPEAYAQQDILRPLLKFAVGDTLVKNVKQHNLNAIKFCFTPDSDLFMYLEKTFPNASIKHAGAISINLLFGHPTLKSSDLFLNIHDEFIELAAKNKNDLLFYNVFNYTSNEDVLYYLLFTMEQFNLDPQFVKLALAAQKPTDDELIKSIKKYIKQVNFSTNEPSVSLTGDLIKLPSHFYFTILNQHLCEL